ncbi:hypothetical protein [Cryobacterium sp. CG_9.6]|uniref:hypothetical protein n=1 Tax=Cryobacterium sp. CG_9.6 TaxID=2760710 RepID=UPI002472EA86|nr:hypothetical protein [Cryobacterium sp. CG_9.6]MDH6236361.1 hypothetical protein [Cryobacterium sp. CG_9.6]
MFGRRRRIAAALAVSAPVPLPVPVPTLSSEQILDVLNTRIDELVGVNGVWTLVPRSVDDTDVFFHGLKAAQIASELSSALVDETAKLVNAADVALAETAAQAAAAAAAAAPVKSGRLARSRVAARTVSGDEAAIEPTALSWTPSPISVWAEPSGAAVTAPAPAPAESARSVA